MVFNLSINGNLLDGHGGLGGGGGGVNSHTNPVYRCLSGGGGAI